VARWAQRSRSNAGLASGWQVSARTGRWWLRLQTSVLRPSLRRVPWYRRSRVPITELGYRLCRVGPVWAYSSAEEVTGRFAPPRQGKTAELANQIIDAPGAVVATSTKPDVVDLTVALREKVGPVLIFNPGQLGGALMRSSFRWNPVIGCEWVEVAIERAGYLLAGSPTMGNVSGREFWQGQAVRVLSRLMHAAALRGGTMLDVLAWVSDLQGSARTVLGLLATSPAGASWADDYRQFLDTNTNTGTSITTSIMPALQWLSDPAVAVTATCGIEEQFDVEAFLASKGTLYLLAEDKPQGTIAPLLVCLTAHIHSAAKAAAGRRPGGRLDPPLTLVLDEVPLICPVPLERWSADSGGRGIVLHYAAQSRAQLFWKWGAEGGMVIWNNTTAKMIFGGCDDEEDLDAYSRLVGERDEKVYTHDAAGAVTGHTTRRVAVLPPSEIRTLPMWHVLLLRKGMRPAIGQIRPAWKRRDVKRAAREARGGWALSMPRVRRQRPTVAPVADSSAPADSAVTVGAEVGD
jgi:type IV secretory pathway TraG/TraD family ATPase VirD4